MAGEQVSVGFLDYSEERSTSGVGVGAVTAVSIAGLLTQIAAYITAIDAITLGTLTFDSLQAYRTPRGSTPPTDPNAQRERAWRVFYADTLPFFDDPVNAIPNAGFGKVFHFDVPTANFDLVDVFPLNTDQADLGQAQIAAFVTALETMARSPYGGTIEVTKIIGVGKAT
jgi:hypothetical protein